MKSILDRSFRYTSSAQTDVRKTFARVRREQQLQQQAQAGAEAMPKIAPISAARSAAQMRRASSAEL